jgi:hypothetical protein
MNYFLKCVILCNIRRTQFLQSSTNELVDGLHNWVLKLAGKKVAISLPFFNYLRISVQEIIFLVHLSENQTQKHTQGGI